VVPAVLLLTWLLACPVRYTWHAGWIYEEFAQCTTSHALDQETCTYLGCMIDVGSNGSCIKMTGAAIGRTLSLHRPVGTHKPAAVIGSTCTFRQHNGCAGHAAQP
jgi:hypothetical protein